jgi:hypothetical protein
VKKRRDPGRKHKHASHFPVGSGKWGAGLEFSVVEADELLVAVSASYFVANRIDSSGPFVMFQASQ